jgi:hypothetical protein
MKIVLAVKEYDSYFIWKQDSVGTILFFIDLEVHGYFEDGWLWSS